LAASLLQEFQNFLILREDFFKFSNASRIAAGGATQDAMLNRGAAMI
jgi:hypothetical protein